MTTIETAGQSATATVCEHAAIFGATPGRDEFDNRDIWDAEDTTDAVCEAFRILIEGVAPDGVQLADERVSVLWGFVNMLDAQTPRRRQAHARPPRPAARAGRHRDQVARALSWITRRRSARSFAGS